MTTPPTPAGWYPDPDGSGGQRYWDGNEWTEHRSPAADAPQAAAEPVGGEQPTSVVPTWNPSTEPRAGSHRRADAGEQPAQTTEPVAQPSEPTEQATEVVRLPSTSDLAPPPSFEVPSFESLSAASRESSTDPGFESQSAPSSETPSFEPSSAGGYEPTPGYEPSSSYEPSPGYEPSSTASFEAAPSFEPPADQPPAAFYDGSATPPPAGDDGRKKALTQYAALVGVLLLILIAAVVYGVFFNKSDNVGINASGNASSSEAVTTPPSTSESTETSTAESATETAAPGAAVDGPLSFEIHGVEVGSSVTMSDAPVTKTAQGEYDVVHMTVTNTGSTDTSFVAMFQKLNAAGTVYEVDNEATAYLEGTFADLQPGASADVSIAFDVPAGTTAESVELHSDPSTPGVVVPLS